MASTPINTVPVAYPPPIPPSSMPSQTNSGAGVFIPTWDTGQVTSRGITVRDLVELAKAGVKIEWYEARQILDDQGLLDYPDSPKALRRALFQRLRWSPYEPSTVQALWCHRIARDKVATFVVTRAGEVLIIEDDYSLFPSDALITQIRLIEHK